MLRNFPLRVSVPTSCNSANITDIFLYSHIIKKESRRLDSLVTSLSELDDGDGRHVVAVLGLALGELQLDAARLTQSD